MWVQQGVSCGWWRHQYTACKLSILYQHCIRKHCEFNRAELTSLRWTSVSIQTHLSEKCTVVISSIHCVGWLVNNNFNVVKYIWKRWWAIEPYTFMLIYPKFTCCKPAYKINKNKEGNKDWDKEQIDSLQNKDCSTVSEFTVYRVRCGDENYIHGDK